MNTPAKTEYEFDPHGYTELSDVAMGVMTESSNVTMRKTFVLEEGKNKKSKRFAKVEDESEEADDKCTKSAKKKKTAKESFDAYLDNIMNESYDSEAIEAGLRDHVRSGKIAPESRPTGEDGKPLPTYFDDIKNPILKAIIEVVHGLFEKGDLDEESATDAIYDYAERAGIDPEKAMRSVGSAFGGKVIPPEKDIDDKTGDNEDEYSDVKRFARFGNAHPDNLDPNDGMPSEADY